MDIAEVRSGLGELRGFNIRYESWYCTKPFMAVVVRRNWQRCSNAQPAGAFGRIHARQSVQDYCTVLKREVVKQPRSRTLGSWSLRPPAPRVNETARSGCSVHHAAWIPGIGINGARRRGARGRV